MWEWIRPLFFLLPPERAHYVSMGLFSTACRWPWLRNRIERQSRLDDPRLVSDVCGIRFANPVGLAAGFDKDARWYHQLDSLGFGAVEVGSITGQGQPGNPRPRLFRLPRDQALINRMGFNNRGADVAAGNLSRVDDRRFRSRSVLGINLGKTKVVPNEQAAQDYAYSFQRLYPFADYLVINVSSPNTPGLRDLQDKQPLIDLLQSLRQWSDSLAQGETVKATDAPSALAISPGKSADVDEGRHRARSGRQPRPVFLKIAPDLTDGQLEDICEIAKLPVVDGVIATNTTICRDGLKTPRNRVEAMGAGGLSGRPLHRRSCEVVSTLFGKLEGAKPIIGVGGIFSGEDAWQMITAGASLIQLYTGFIYGGPETVRKINQTLLQKLEQQGLKHIGQAVGWNHPIAGRYRAVR